MYKNKFLSQNKTSNPAPLKTYGSSVSLPNCENIHANPFYKTHSSSFDSPPTFKSKYHDENKLGINHEDKEIFQKPLSLLNHNNRKSFKLNQSKVNENSQKENNAIKQNGRDSKPNKLSQDVQNSQKVKEKAKDKKIVVEQNGIKPSTDPKNLNTGLQNKKENKKIDNNKKKFELRDNETLENSPRTRRHNKKPIKEEKPSKQNKQHVLDQNSNVVETLEPKKKASSASKRGSKSSQLLKDNENIHVNGTKSNENTQKCSKPFKKRKLDDFLKETSNKREEKIVKEKQTINSSQFTFSQPNNCATHRERLEWLRDRRSVGTWIQCCHQDCSKWRYEPNIKDPILVPEEWFCNMNSDKEIADCNAPDSSPNSAVEEDLIHNKYTAGSIVWAKMKGYPWWPAMVDDCPDTEQYYWLNGFSDIPVSYHVVYFDTDAVLRNWLPVDNLQPFITGTEHARTRIDNECFKTRIKVAKQQALEALELDISDRLMTYGFLARWEEPINSPSSTDDDDDNAETNNDECLDVDTVVNLSHELSFDNDDSFNRKQKRKTNKRKIEDSPDVESMVQKMFQGNNSQLMDSKPSKVDSLIDEDRDPVLNNTQATNELINDLEIVGDVVTSTNSLIDNDDNTSLHSSNLFNSDEELGFTEN